MSDTNHRGQEQHENVEKVPAGKQQIVEGTVNTPPDAVDTDGNTGAGNVNNPARNDNAFEGEITMDEATGGA